METSRAGFGALTSLHHALSRFDSLKIELDCTEVSWLDANLAAPLGGIRQLAKSRGNEISFTNLNQSVMTVLSRSGFLPTPAIDYFGTSIPYKCFERVQSVLFAEYTELQMQARRMPTLSAQLRSKFLEGLDEIFNNASIHSKSEHGIYCCGQAYPKSNKLKFTIADVGIGIRRSLLSNRGFDIPTDDAIDWAMTEGATARVGDVPGGLGLKILREFIEMNGGEIQIVSETGYWVLRRGQKHKHKYLRPYPGT